MSSRDQRNFEKGMADRRIRILQLIGGLNRGGAEQVVINLCNHLDSERFKVAIVSLGDSTPMAARLDPIKDIAVMTCGRAPGIPSMTNFIFCYKNLRKAVRAFKPDVIHSHLYSFNAPLQWLASIGLCCSHLVTIHISGLHYTDRNNFPSLIFRFCEVLNIWLSNAKVVTVSKSVASTVYERLIIKPSRIVVSYNGVDTQFLFFRNQNSDYRKRLKSSCEQNIVVNIARFYPQKGHKDLIMAWSQVLSQIPIAKLLLVGDGPLRHEMEALAEKLRLGESVQFLGARDDVPQILAASDLGVFPSLFEGLPVAPIEMMSMGLPVVASDIGPLREVIGTGPEKGGLLVPPGDDQWLAEALVRLLRDAGLRNRLGHAARQRACRYFSIKSQVAQHERLYSELARGLKRHGSFPSRGQSIG